MQLFPWNVNFRVVPGLLLAAGSVDSGGGEGEAGTGVLSSSSRAVYIEDERSEAGTPFERLSFFQRVPIMKIGISNRYLKRWI
jgi:hypothetical protein